MTSEPRTPVARAEHPTENTLLDFLDGRLSPPQRAQVQAHVERCELCQAVADESKVAVSTMFDTTHRPGLPDSARKSLQPEALLGSTVGEYLVEEVIGSGGMGIVYAGHHPLIGRKVAIKVLRPELAADSESMRRMLGEARAVSSIGHRGVVDVFAFGDLGDGRQYMVMEYLEGESLQSIVRREAPMPAERLVELLDGVLEALAATHEAGVIHRDLKPSNIHLVPQGDRPSLVKLLDFGLARREADAGGHTRVGGVVLGTPAYMAPEQILRKPVDARTDLYAVGVIAYEMATGRRPFRATTAHELLRMHVGERPPAPSTLAPDLDVRLQAVILKLLEKQPERRPPSADAVRAELRKVAPRATRRRPPRGARTPLVSRRVLAVMGGLGLMVIAAAGTFALLKASAPVPAPRVVSLPDAGPVVVAVAAVEPHRPVAVQTSPPPPERAVLFERPSPQLGAERVKARALKLLKQLEADPIARDTLRKIVRDAGAVKTEAQLGALEKRLSTAERTFAP